MKLNKALYEAKKNSTHKVIKEGTGDNLDPAKKRRIDFILRDLMDCIDEYNDNTSTLKDVLDCLETAHKSISTLAK